MHTLLVAVLVVLAAQAQADTSNPSETTRVKTYGNCKTSTHIDLFTDEESYEVLCSEYAGWFDVNSIGLFQKAGRLYVLLDQTFLSSDDELDVMIRIDKGEIIQRTALTEKLGNDRQATIQDYPLALSLIDQLSHGKRAVVKIGDKGGSIRLNGSRRAIQDFRERAGLTQQTLTPQQRQTLEIPARKRF